MTKNLRLLFLAAGLILVAAAAAARRPVVPPGWHSSRVFPRLGAESPEGGRFDAGFFERLIPLHRLKAPPGPGDWLSSHREPGQTFADYLALRPALPDERKKILYLVLIGDFDPTRQKAVRQTAEVLEAYFGLRTVFLPPVPLSVIPPSVQRFHPVSGEHQLLTRYLMEAVLKPRKPADAFALLAFTAEDLWPGEGWNFVFGEASPQDRLGVWSLYRYGDPNQSPESYQLFLKRSLKIATHETGHLFSLAHCPYYECNLNGSNHLGEADRQPLWLCPVCLRKLTWAAGQDPAARYERLRDLCGWLGLREEERFYHESLRLLRSLSAWP